MAFFLCARKGVINLEEIRFEVVPLASQTPYTHDSEILATSDGLLQTADIHVPIDEDSGAFNIHRTIHAGYQWMKRNAPASAITKDSSSDKLFLRELRIRWTEGLRATEQDSGDPLAPSSAYNHDITPKTILIDGRDTDVDEFDDPVMLHEFMHFALFNSSFTGPGESHAKQMSAAGAFLEGLPSALAQDVMEAGRFIARSRPFIKIFDFEEGFRLADDPANPGSCVADNEDDKNACRREFTKGTSNGKDTGRINEFLITMLVWDLLDRDDSESFDLIDGGRAGVMHSVFEYIPTHIENDPRGIWGRPDLVNFLDGWREFVPDRDDELKCLTEAIQFPYDFEGNPDPECPVPIAEEP